MKIKNTIAIAVTLAALNLPAQKIAHLSFDSLIKTMPETKVASEIAQQYLSGLTEQSMAMQKEFEAKYKDYLEKEPGMSDLVKKSKQEDLQQLQTRIQDFQRQAELDYRKRYAELSQPVIEKAKKGIDAAAKEGGYKYVLDTSPQSPSVLYHESGDDILAAVKKKLDSMPAAKIPGTRDEKSGVNPPAQGNKPSTPNKPGK
jgi:outer membrane protein